MTHIHDSSITERVRTVLRSHLAEGVPSLEEVAAALKMGPRTMRQRLKAEGVNYSLIKSRLRFDAAIELLARPELAMEAIAEHVGFADASAFCVAFRNWTGVAPGHYRRKLLGESRPT